MGMGSNPEMPNGPVAAGCCDASQRPIPANAFVVVLVAWFLTCRRGTTHLAT
jgi:hypothetical protein